MMSKTLLLLVAFLGVCAANEELHHGEIHHESAEIEHEEKPNGYVTAAVEEKVAKLEGSQPNTHDEEGNPILFDENSVFPENWDGVSDFCLPKLEPAHDQEATIVVAYSAEHELDALYARAKFEGSDEWQLIFYDESFQGGDHGEVTASFSMPDKVTEVKAFGHCKHYGAWGGEHLIFHNNHEEL